MLLKDIPAYYATMAQVAQVVPWEYFVAKTIFVTGARGLIGSAVVDLLSFGNAAKMTNCKIIVSGRDAELLRRRFVDDVVSCVQYDALKPVDFDINADVVVDCASPATPNDFIEFPVETILTNVVGSHELMKFADKCCASKFVYVSSSEVYGKNRPPPSGYAEDQYGEIDVLSDRSCYPIAKRAAENLCATYARRSGLNVSIVRPGHIYGPTAGSHDNRVSSSFPLQAAIGKPITLKSSGNSLRSYTYCLDCASAILTVVAKGVKCEAYNIASRSGVCSIRQMAEVVAAAGHVELKFDAPSLTDIARFNPMDDSTLNPAKLEALGWRGVVDFKTGFSQTVECLKHLLEGE